jgi:curli biogenesis system outer membrane secretion channel CsgG
MKILKNMLLVMIFTGLTASQTQASEPRLGVADFSNTSGAYWWSGGVGRDLASMVTNELANNGSFNVVERDKLYTVLDEQDLSASGRISKSTRSKIGELTGAQYLVLGTVTAYEENTEGTGGGFTISGVRIGGKNNKAYMALDLRVVDTNTGEIAYNRTVEARTGGFGFKLGLSRGNFSGDLGKYKKTPAGKAIRAAVVEIVDYLECAMVVQGSCLEDFDAKEKKRKKSLKSLINLD